MPSHKFLHFSASMFVAIGAFVALSGCAARGPETQNTVLVVRPVERATTRPTTATAMAVPLGGAGNVSAPLLLTEGSGNLVSAQPLVGLRVRVRFRRDALGMTQGAGIVEPSADMSAGKPLYVDGLLERVTSDAVLLHNGENTIWIPAGNVLMIETVK